MLLLGELQSPLIIVIALFMLLFMTVFSNAGIGVQTAYAESQTYEAEAPVNVVNGISLEMAAEELRALLVPFDNDKWVRYESTAMPNQLESYEVTAIFEPASRKGLVVGSVAHDTWKTGLRVVGHEGAAIHHLEVYGGAAGEYTRDTIPHGTLIGKTITSPRIFVGMYADYRTGLEEYG